MEINFDKFCIVQGVLIYYYHVDHELALNGMFINLSFTTTFILIKCCLYLEVHWDEESRDSVRLFKKAKLPIVKNNLALFYVIDELKRVLDELKEHKVCFLLTKF